MRNARDRRYVTLDIEHMRRLHQEAIEQLDLMRTATEAAERATGTMRDTLEVIAMDHWNAYMDVIHMVLSHDNEMANAMKKYQIGTRNEELDEQMDQSIFANQLLLVHLLKALSRSHRRFYDIYGLRGNPMSEYLKESMTVEREHIAEIIGMIQDTI